MLPTRAKQRAPHGPNSSSPKDGRGKLSVNVQCILSAKPETTEKNCYQATSGSSKHVVEIMRWIESLGRVAVWLVDFCWRIFRVETASRGICGVIDLFLSNVLHQLV